MNIEELKKLALNKDFTDCVNDAAPYRVKIMQDYSPRMKEVKKEFFNILMECDYKGISKIRAAIKKDKTDTTAKAEYARWRGKMNKLFAITVKCIHPDANSTPSAGMIYTAGSLLNYINRSDVISNNLSLEDDVEFKFKDFSNNNTELAKDDVKTRMSYLFKEADEIQGDICTAADAIKIDIYEKLPSNIRFDKSTNKKGLKPTHFQNIVRNKAIGMIKDEDKYTKYMNKKIEENKNNIVREEIILTKNENL